MQSWHNVHIFGLVIGAPTTHCRRHHLANRVRTVSTAQRHSLPTEPMHDLPVPGTMPGKQEWVNAAPMPLGPLD